MIISSVPHQIGHYRLEEEIGSGAFSVVYRATSFKNGNNDGSDSQPKINPNLTTFAIKVFPKRNLANKEDEERFQREVNAMAFMKHPNIVSLRDLLSDDKNFYLVMDYCGCGDLSRYIRNSNGRIPENIASRIFKQIVVAVTFCHSYGVAHRDLKPENILIERFYSQNDESVKNDESSKNDDGLKNDESLYIPKIRITDFGLCGYTSQEKLMETFCGSPCFCAPECLCGIKYDGKLADAWSLGVILYTLVTGGQPWAISSATVMTRNIVKGFFSIPKYLSQNCHDLINSLMKINPRTRMKVEEILTHPFILEYDIPHSDEDMNFEISRSEYSLEELSQLSAKTSQVFDLTHNIISPFEDQPNNGDDDRNNCDKNSTNIEHNFGENDSDDNKNYVITDDEDLIHNSTENFLKRKNDSIENLSGSVEDNKDKSRNVLRIRSSSFTNISVNCSSSRRPSPLSKLKPNIFAARQRNINLGMKNNMSLNMGANSNVRSISYGVKKKKPIPIPNSRRSSACQEESEKTEENE
ncbi:CAMK family protein kinase [Tritrichomonas foetus]|uniref:CAMK family protein kinase n=1 Tax=Tritrichomonas foetus TaxID=1144522 RepID=A0A1J4KLP0_9EUKA|nr:CAMK family protein kinase [Tritrichomonas foetus]|eukprot:OHT12131.1 CAMK family protein kinase [Tritrichomonas foetus]